MKKVKYKYFKTLGDSVQLVFNNPRLLVPSALIFVIMLAYSFVIREYILPQAAIISMIILLALLSLFAVGWTWSMINQLMVRNKFDLSSSIKRAFSFAIRDIGIDVIAVLFIIAVYFIIALLVLIFSKIWLPIIGLIIGLVFIVLFFLFLTAIMQATPVLIVQDRGVIETIKQTLLFYFRKKLYSLNIFLVSALFVLVLMIPSVIYQIIIIGGIQQFITPKALFELVLMIPSIIQQLITPELISYTATQSTILNLLQIPVYLGSVIVIIYYCVSYKIKKATIKVK